MRKIIRGGWLDDSIVRKARKRHACENPQCPRDIERGDLYVEGDIDPYRAGGFGHERFCIVCAGPDATIIEEAA